MTRAEQITKSLSAEQCAALAAREWSMMMQYRAGIAELLQFGLMERDHYGHKLTPLGLEVRAILQSKGTTSEQ